MRAAALTVIFFVLAVTSGERRHRLRHISRLFQSPESTKQLAKDSIIQKDSNYVKSEDIPKYTIIEHEEYNELKVVGDQCTDLACGPGRQCIVGTSGTESCECAEPDSCPPGHKLVCGSDGNLYESHCSLHRTACKKGQKIFVDRVGEACFQREMLKEAVQVSRDADTVMSKKKDLSQSHYVNDAPEPELVSSPKETCTATRFNEFKHLLKIYHCNRLGLASCDDQESPANKALVSKIFGYYDRDGDGLLTEEELNYAEGADHMEKLAHICTLSDLLVYSYLSAGQIYIDFTAFSLEFGVAREEAHNVLYTGNSRVTYFKADGYSGTYLTCDTANTSQCLWLRNGVEIDFYNTNGISMLADGRLFITAVNLDHTANYTCFDILHPTVQDTQLLVVQVKPVVRSNEIGDVMEGVTTTLKCHSDGVPEPSVQWQVSQYNLPDDSNRYYRDNRNTSVNILRPKVELDSAEYQCVAKSSAGWAFSETNVHVIHKDEYEKVDFNKPNKGSYLVLHGSGYITYSGKHCHITHSINKHASHFVSNLKDSDSTLGHLCPFDEDCDWSSAVVVREKLVYASQPSLNRVVVIDVVDDFLPKHVITMEHSVHSLYYLPATNSLWMLVGNQAQFQTVLTASAADSIDTLQVGSLISHPSVFDSVEELFIPTQTPFNRSSRYAYTSHYDQHGLSRLDTVTMAYDADLPLSNWKCQPISFHHLAIGGLALAECGKGHTNLVIDTINNVVVRRFTAGSLHVSPNTRYIVTVNKPDRITVHFLHDNATVSLLYEHTVQMPIDQVRFMASTHSPGYDLAITSPNENAVLFIDLKTKKTDMLEGLLSGRSNTTASTSTSSLVTTSNEFEDHLMLPSRGALFVINKKYHMISCEWTDILNYQLSLWIDV